MGWYALEEVEEAAKRTRELLLPFDWRLWARIAIMAFFVGGFTFPGFGGNYAGSPDSGMHDQDMAANTDFGLANIDGPGLPDMRVELANVDGLGLTNIVLLGIIFGVLGIGLLFGVLRSVFGFVYYQSLLDDDVRIRSNFVKHFFKGLKLFVFEVSAVFAFLAIGGLLVLPVFVNPFFAIFTILFAIPLIMAAAVFFQLTTDFIPLLMIDSDRGVMASWAKLYDMIVDEWRQVGLYVIAKVVLGVLFQIAVASAGLLLGLLLILPIGLVALVFYWIAQPLAIVAAVAGIILWLASVIYFLNGPATTFFRYYSILVYDDLTQEEAVEG
ncbi:DUF7544 domain-containing protein [Candidatus Nanohalovita haloferacivicina]|uniref:DUF7544 domain-containing protein n=1 Tax=Candidatus Nanohalovita haloferacivicina TaxID=2978046 RepID=UPI00325F9D4A|nr:putative membrane protein [Candidatus Nanohalobia archaeon BNXNv]